MTNENNLYRIAKILRGHGIKGEMKISPMNRHLNGIKKETVVFLSDRFNKIQVVNIEKMRLSRAEGIVKFREIDDRTAADKFAGGYLLIDKSDLPSLPKDEYYIDDLIGMEVLDDKGSKIGVLNEVYSQSSYDIYEVLHDGKRSLVPAVAEFVTAIDTKKRTITLRVIEGLLD